MKKFVLITFSLFLSLASTAEEMDFQDFADLLVAETEEVKVTFKDLHRLIFEEYVAEITRREGASVKAVESSMFTTMNSDYLPSRNSEQSAYKIFLENGRICNINSLSRRASYSHKRPQFKALISCRENADLEKALSDVEKETYELEVGMNKATDDRDLWVENWNHNVLFPMTSHEIEHYTNQKAFLKLRKEKLDRFEKEMGVMIKEKSELEAAALHLPKVRGQKYEFETDLSFSLEDGQNCRLKEQSTYSWLERRYNLIHKFECSDPTGNIVTEVTLPSMFGGKESDIPNLSAWGQGPIVTKTRTYNKAIHPNLRRKVKNWKSVFLTWKSFLMGEGRDASSIKVDWTQRRHYPPAPAVDSASGLQWYEPPRSHEQ